MLMENCQVSRLIGELLREGKEREWLEFKMNLQDPKEIGKYISALSNSAALAGKSHGFAIWGIQDSTKQVAGTSFDPSTARIGNEELESWLSRMLRPRIGFHFESTEANGKRLVLLSVEKAYSHPVQFQNVEYIRLGTTTRPLNDYPAKARALWMVLNSHSFEENIAADSLSDEEALSLLDVQAYFDLLEHPVPGDRQGILEALLKDNLVHKTPLGSWGITNLGAILLAKDLSEFKSLKRKAPRIIFYKAADRTETSREIAWQAGYASGFESAIASLVDKLPSNEVIARALRKNVPMYPELAIRELVANALIHQDFTVPGTGPMIEVFDQKDRNH